MLIQEEIKSKINQIDFKLKEVFENVSIIEKSERIGNFFEVVASSDFIFEDGSIRNASVRLKIYKKDMISENAHLKLFWSYQLDTLDESSEWIERSSKIEDLSNDVNNVILHKQMSESYFSKLEDITPKINESNTNLEMSIEDKIKNVLSGYKVDVKSIEYGEESPLFENNEFMTTSSDKKIYFIHEGIQIKISDKFKIEADIKKLSGINYVSFGDNDIMIDYSK